MEVWSKGLGTSKLNLRLEKATVENHGDSVVFRGKMGPPVFWDFSITMTKQDLDDVLHVAAKDDTISFLLDTPGRWDLYGIAVVQVLKVIGKFIMQALKRPFTRR